MPGIVVRIADRPQRHTGPFAQVHSKEAGAEDVDDGRGRDHVHHLSDVAPIDNQRPGDKQYDQRGPPVIETCQDRTAGPCAEGSRQAYPAAKTRPVVRRPGAKAPPQSAAGNHGQDGRDGDQVQQEQPDLENIG